MGGLSDRDGELPGETKPPMVVVLAVDSGSVSACVDEFRSDTQKNQGLSELEIKTGKNASNQGWVAACRETNPRIFFF
jgi:hypothetical protein